jgi:hypothetical protein
MFCVFTSVLSECLQFCTPLFDVFVPVILLRCFLNDFEMGPFDPIITGITFAFIYHVH